MLKIFLSSKDKNLIDNTFGAALKRLRPDVPAHEFIPFDASETPVPTEGGVVLVAGDKCHTSLVAKGVFPKNKKYRSIRGTPYKHSNGGVYLTTFDPFLTISEPDTADQIAWDVFLAYRFLKTGQIKPQIGKYEWVGSYSPLIARIEKEYAKTGTPVDLAMDLETMGFDPWKKGAQIVSFSVTKEAGTAEVLYTGPNFPDPVAIDEPAEIFLQVAWLLTSPKVRTRWANGKFDMKWIRECWGIDCTNFTFDPLLAASLLNENRSCSLNNLTKIEIPLLGGYDDCVAPHTRLLMADMTWKTAGDIQPGDQLVGFDEESPGGSGFRRRMRLAKAVSTKRLTKPGARVTLSNGTVIECSDDHGFLSPRGANGGSSLWRRVHQLKPGDRLKAVAPVTSYDSSREAGYLAGIFDGEGYISRSGGGLCSGWSQKPGIVQERIAKAMQERGLEYYVAGQKNGDGVITCKGAAWETMKMLQMLQPSRLLASMKWDGFTLPQEPEPVTVVSIEPLGPIEVVSLETDVHTFVAEGIASHNSFNDTHDKGHFELIPPDDEYLGYAGGDTDATQRVSDKVKDQLLSQPKLARFYVECLHPAARTFEKIESRGIMIDRHKYELVRDRAKSKIKELTDKAMYKLPNRLKLKFKEKIEEQIAKGKSPLTPQIKGEYFFSDLGLNLKPKIKTEKTGKPSTAANHFEMFSNVEEAKEMSDLLKELGQAEKILGTYCDGFLKHLRDDDKFHPSYFLFNGNEGYEKGDGGTVTGRLSAIDPAIQTVPKHSLWGKLLRECFIAPDGYLIYECDFSQGELRVAACVAPDKAMIAAYKEGMDLHGITGALASGVTYEEVVAMKQSKDKALKQMAKDIRQKGKAGNFGLLYGMSAEGFQEYARVAYGVHMTMDEATAFRHKFLYEQWKGLPLYHDRMKKFVRNTGYVESPLGRVRHLPLINSKDQYYSSQAERQAINSPIQSTLSDMMLLALVEQESNFDQDTIYSTMVIHDASVGCVKKSVAVETMKQVTQMMENLPLHKFDWSPELTFPADSSLGEDWGNMMEEGEYMQAIEEGKLLLA